MAEVTRHEPDSDDDAADADAGEQVVERAGTRGRAARTTASAVPAPGRGPSATRSARQPVVASIDGRSWRLASVTPTRSSTPTRNSASAPRSVMYATTREHERARRGTSGCRAPARTSDFEPQPPASTMPKPNSSAADDVSQRREPLRGVESSRCTSISPPASSSVVRQWPPRSPAATAAFASSRRN